MARHRIAATLDSANSEETRSGRSRCAGALEGVSVRVTVTM
jgi:hypothetical protein